MRCLPLFLGISLTSCVVAQEDESTGFIQEVLVAGDILPNELTDSLQVKDFSTLWTRAPNWLVYGFIGDDYQRLRVKFLSVVKDKADPKMYRVHGKDKVKANICDFQGELRITHVRQYKAEWYGEERPTTDSSLQGRFVVCGTYRFLEDSVQLHAGEFTGSFASYFYLDPNGSVRYDDIEDIADGYCNNQFVGVWVSFDGGISKRCNWGDARIPNGEQLDGGAGEFGPDEKYANNGWQNYIDAYMGADPSEDALLIEREEWWK